MKSKKLIGLLMLLAMPLAGCNLNPASVKPKDEPVTPVDQVSVSLNKTSLSLVAGTSETLTATVTGSTAAKSWTSNRPEIASVDQTGKVTAVDEGTAIITVTVAGKSAFCTVTVTPDEGGGGGSQDDDNPPVGDVLSIAQAKALMDAAGDGVVVSGLKKVKGVVASGSNFKSDYKEYSGHFEGEDNFLFTFKDPNNLLNGGSADGKEVVIEGYLEFYQGNYKLSYLPANVSPTGEKFTPSLVSAKDGGGGGGSQDDDNPPVTGAISVTEAIKLMDQAGDGKVVSGLKKVSGVIASGSEYNSEYNEYSAHFEGHSDFFVQFKDPNNVLGGKSADGYTVVVEGYLELYQGEYKMAYLPANVSPTGAKFTPNLVSATKSGGGSEDEGGGGGGETDIVKLAKNEAIKIAVAAFDVQASELTFADYEDDEAEADVYTYESSALSFYAVIYGDFESSTDDAIAEALSYVPVGATKDTEWSEGKMDASGEDYEYGLYYDVYVKDGIGYEVYVDYYYDDDIGHDTAVYLTTFPVSQINEFMDYMYGESGGGEHSEGDAIVVDFAEVPAVSGLIGDIEFDTSKATGASDPAYNDQNKELRLYANNTLTISSDTNIVKIEFTINECTDDRTKVDFASVDVGSYNDFVWTGCANEVTFTCPASGQVHVQEFVVTLEGGEVVPVVEDEVLEAEAVALICDYYDVEESEVVITTDEEDDYYDIVLSNYEDLILYTAGMMTDESSFDDEVSYLEDYMELAGYTMDDSSSEEGYYEAYFVNNDGIMANVISIDMSELFVSLGIIEDGETYIVSQVSFFYEEYLELYEEFSGSGEEEETFTGESEEWPLEEIASCVGEDYAAMIPVINGTSYKFECYPSYSEILIDIAGGDSDAFYDALELAGFELGYDEENDYNYAISPDEVLEVDFYEEDEIIYLDIWAYSGGGGGGEDIDLTDLESIASYIAYAVLDDPTAYEEVEEGVYGLAFNYGKEGDATLDAAVKEVWYYTPEAFVLATQPTIETDKDGEYGIMTTADEDELVYIDIISFVEEGNIVINIYIYVPVEA